MSGHLALAEVRRRCADGRFFPYEGWRDRFFAPLAVPLIWVFLRLGWTGNAVSFLSGGVAAAGACMMACHDPRFVVAGSFGYAGFYLLDYVDGGVARIRGQGSIGGQYVDWAMHAVAAVGTAAGLFAGALRVTGMWIVPFGVLGTVAAVLSLDRYALGWFAICMHHQQLRAKSVQAPSPVVVRARAEGKARWFFRNLSTVCFHENFAILLLPALSLGQWALAPARLDFRIVLTILAGGLYCPVVAADIWRLATEGWVDRAYSKLLYSDAPPQLPEDHFLN